MNFIYGFLILFVAQAIVWFQCYGPLKIEWLSNNKWIIYVAAIPITWMFLKGTELMVTAFDGATWGPKFIQFCAGIISFAILSYIFNNESITLKEVICLGLSLCIICIQLFWK